MFIPMSGEYIIPNILSGGNYEFVGNVIGDQFSSAQNQPFGSALSISLMIALSGFVALYILFATQGGAVRCLGASDSSRPSGRSPPGRWCVFAFLYLPIAVMALFAFNKPSPAALAAFHGSNVCDIPPSQLGNLTVWNGFTTCWFKAGLHDPTYIPAIVTSAKIAAAAAIVSTAARASAPRSRWRG